MTIGIRSREIPVKGRNGEESLIGVSFFRMLAGDSSTSFGQRGSRARAKLEERDCNRSFVPAS
jgi:hypothetical protein